MVNAFRKGIIPARAGFTYARRSGDLAGRDHPRSRGVYMAGTFEGFVFRGSSPLARGLRQDNIIGGVADRIIPARAGFTCFRRF